MSTVQWPVDSEPGASSLSVAMFDHRECGGMEEALNMAENYIASQTSFFCVFIVLKPISKKQKNTGGRTLEKERMNQLIRRFVKGADPHCRRRHSLIMVDLSLVAVASSHLDTGETLLSTADSLTEKSALVTEKLTEPLKFIETNIRAVFEHQGKMCTCFSHSFQSQSLAVCIMALNGGNADDALLARKLIAHFMPNAEIPLVIAHVPKNDRAHLSVGHLDMTDGLMWMAHSSAGVADLKVNMGNAYSWKANLIADNGVTTSAATLTKTVKLPSNPPQFSNTRRTRVPPVTAWRNLVQGCMISHDIKTRKEGSLEMRAIKEEKLTKKISEDNAAAAKDKAHTKSYKPEPKPMRKTSRKKPDKQPNSEETRIGIGNDPQPTDASTTHLQCLSMQSEEASASHSEPRDLVDDKFLRPYSKPVYIAEKPLKKGRDKFKKAETNEESHIASEQPLGSALSAGFMQAAANIGASLLTAKLKYNTVVAPELMPNGNHHISRSAGSKPDQSPMPCIKHRVRHGCVL